MIMLCKVYVKKFESEIKEQQGRRKDKKEITWKDEVKGSYKKIKWEDNKLE